MLAVTRLLLFIRCLVYILEPVPVIPVIQYITMILVAYNVDDKKNDRRDARYRT